MEPCKYVRLAQERQERDLKKLPGKGYTYDEKAAARVTHFIEGYCKHWKGEWAGQPLHLGDWQSQDILNPIFGWRKPDGTRRYRYAYVEIPRKNGKSTMAAGVGLYLTIADNEPGAEVYCSATKKDQAKIVFNDAKEMLRQSPRLQRWAGQFKNNIHCRRLKSKFEPLGADKDTLDGLNTHGNIVDELHAHKTRGLLDVLVTSTGARRQPLSFYITTAGLYVPTSVGWQEHEYAEKVLDGSVDDDSYFAYIAHAEKDSDYGDPAIWKAASPNYGVSVKEDYLQGLWKKAQEQPGFFNSFLRYHLNIWTEQVERVIDMDDWAACEADFSAADLRGQECFAGLDLSSKTDITALVLLFPKANRFLWFFWVPQDNILKRAQKDRVPYDAWVRDGWLRATPGPVVDYDVIERDILGIADTFKIKEIAFDEFNATQMATHLIGHGFTMVEYRQSFGRLSEATKELLKMIKGKEAEFKKHPVARWMASNLALAENSYGDIRPDRKKSTEKIDGIAGAVMALDRMIRHDSGGSVYDSEDLKVIE